MAAKNLYSTVSLIQNTDQNFNLYDVLSRAGFTAPPPVADLSIQIKNANGTYSTAPANTYWALDLDSGIGKETLHVAMSTLPTFTGEQDLKLLITDGAKDTIQLFLAVMVLPVPPVAHTDTATILEDTVATGNVLTNDSAPSGHSLSVTQFQVNGSDYTAGTTANLTGIGTLTINGDGSYTFTPATHYYGSVPAATYTVTDGTSTATAALSINVTPLPPTANPDSQTILENTVATGNILTNDTDINGQPLTVTGFTVAGQNHAVGETAVIANVGTLTVLADGGYTFTPLPNYYGSVPVSVYTISDGLGSSSSTLTINVLPLPPTAVPDSQAIPENGVATGNLLANDVDINGKAVTVTSFTVDGQSHTAGETAIISNVGTLTISPDGSCTFAPAANYYGPMPQAQYTISDGLGSSTSTLDISVTPAPPIANPDLGIATDAPVSGNVLNNDSDPNGQALHVTEFSIDGQTYSAGQTALLSGIGNLTIASDGSYAFTPVLHYLGTIPQATYTVSDGLGTATSTLTVMNLAIADDVQILPSSTDVLENGTVTGNALGNAAASPGYALSIISFTLDGTTIYAAGNTASIAGVGNLTLNSDGSYEFTPVLNYIGPVPQASFTVSDGVTTLGSTLDITITPLPPVANADVQTIVENTVATGNVLTNDTEINGQPVKVVGFVVDNLAHAAGDAAVIDGVGTLTIAEDGSYSFVPSTNYHGNLPQATYLMSDGLGSSTATLDITVTPVGPVAHADSQTVVENSGSVSGNVLANDSEINGQTLTVTDFTVAGQNLSAGQTAAIANVGSLTVNADGSYRFVPVANYYGAVPTVGYTMTDGLGTSASTLTINVTPVGPVANTDSQTIAANTTATGNVLTNDTDINGKALVVTGFDVNGSHYTAGATASITGVGSLVINTNGSYTFTPATNYSGPVPVATYQISDTLGTASSTLTLNVTPATSTGIDIVKLVEGIYTNGTGGEGLTPGYWKNHTPDCYGNASEWFKTGYSPNDSFNTVFGVNVAGNPTLLTALNAGGGGLIALMRQATAALLSTSDPNISYLYGKAEVISLTQQAILTGQYDGVQNLFATQNNLEANLTTQATAATTVITPLADANTPAESVTIGVNGEAHFVYRVSNTGTAALSNVQVTDSVVSNVTYVSGDTNKNGLLDVGETWTYTDFQVVSTTGLQWSTGTATAVNASTGKSVTDSDGVYINGTVSAPTPPNSAPTQTLATCLVTNEDSALALGSSNGKSITVADANGGALTTTLTVANGTLTLAANGGATLTGNGTGTVILVGTAAQINAALASFSYKQSVADWNGADTLTVSTSDGLATTTNSTSITVTPVADIANDSASTTQGTAVTLNVLANDTFENASHPITAINGMAIASGGSVAVANGTVTLNGAGQLVFAPTSTYSGSTCFSYTVTSGGVTETATVNVTVTPTNHNPDAVNDCFQLTQTTAKLLSWEDLAGGGDRDFNDAIMKVVANANGSVTVTFLQDNAGYNNTLGYYLKDANGNPTAGKVMFADSDTSAGHTCTIPASALAGKTYGFFLIADGGNLNSTLADNASVSFAKSNGNWCAFDAHGHKLVGQGANLFFDDAQFNSDGYTTGTTLCGSGNVGEGMVHVHTSQQVLSATASGNVLSNDTDVDKDTLTVSSFTQAAHGIVTMAANGAFSYTAATGYLGNDSFTYTLSDGHGGTDTATVSLGSHCACVDHQITWTQGGCSTGKTISIDLSKYVCNQDGSSLHYSFDSATSGHGSYSDCNYSVQSFDANTGCLKLYVHSHGADSWTQDGFCPDLKFSAIDSYGNCNQGSIKVNAWDCSPGSPIAFDLNHNGQIDVTGQTTAREGDHGTLGRTVQFDINGDGSKETIEWMQGTGDGLLVDNRDGHAASDMNGARLFGNDATHDNGYAKLAELDSNHDGVLTGDELKGLQVWVDNGDAQVQAGELHGLADFGITAINVNFNLVQDAHGDTLTRSAAGTADGGSIMTEDVWFGALGNLNAATSATVPALGDLLSHDGSLDSLVGSANPTTVGTACAATAAAASSLDSLKLLASLAEQNQPVAHA